MDGVAVAAYFHHSGQWAAQLELMAEVGVLRGGWTVGGLDGWTVGQLGGTIGRLDGWTVGQFNWWAVGVTVGRLDGLTVFIQ